MVVHGGFAHWSDHDGKSLMSMNEMLKRVARLRVHNDKGHRAPNKPLLLLVAVQRAEQGLAAHAPWSWWAPRLESLLLDYAPSGKANAHYPYRRLEVDELWDIPGLEQFPAEAFIAAGKGNVRDFRVTWLRREDPKAGLPAGDHGRLIANQTARDQVVRLILQLHFAPTLWSDLLVDAEVTHDLNAVISFPRDVAEIARGKTRQRSPTFAREVLAADGEVCVVCRYDGREDRSGELRPVGFDAAHVKWFNVSGPDDISNGLTLCATHHRLFDRGFFTFHPDSGLLVRSKRFSGTGAVAQLPEGIRVPPRIDPQYLGWQYENVFKKPT